MASHPPSASASSSSLSGKQGSQAGSGRAEAAGPSVGDLLDAFASLGSSRGVAAAVADGAGGGGGGAGAGRGTGVGTGSQAARGTSGFAAFPAAPPPSAAAAAGSASFGSASPSFDPFGSFAAASTACLNASRFHAVHGSQARGAYRIMLCRGMLCLWSCIIESHMCFVLV